MNNWNTQQQMIPWQPQQQPQLQPAPPAPPGIEDTILAGAAGAGLFAVMAQSVMALGELHPTSLTANGMITAGAALFGGTVTAMGYRSHANRAYEAACRAAGMTGTNPGDAVMRLRGTAKNLGHVDVTIPAVELVKALKDNNPTPEVVDIYFQRASEYAVDAASRAFMQQMPHPQNFTQYAPPPQWTPSPWGQQPPVFYAVPPGVAPPNTPPPGSNIPQK